MSNIKNTLYNIIDAATLNRGIKRKINGFSILFPAKWSRYFESDYESENVAYIKTCCKPNMVAFDIGAHLGLMSVSMAQLVGSGGKVYCFEPTPNTFKVLNKVIELNQVTGIVQPVNAAVTAKKGVLEFFLAADEGSNSNSLVSKNHRSRVPVKINATSLDAFVAENNIQQIDFIKIDAEGSELDVLSGGLESMKRFKPKMILAIHPPLIENNNQTVESVYNALTNMGCTIRFKNEVMTKEKFCSTRDFFDVHLSF